MPTLEVIKNCLNAQTDIVELVNSLTKEDLTKLEQITKILLTVTDDQEVITAFVLETLCHCDLLSLNEVRKTYNKAIINLLTSSNKITTLCEISPSNIAKKKRHQESLRKMLISLAKDIRVVFTILAKQLYLLREVKLDTTPIKHAVALQTREIFAPLANRLGIWRLKWELEDFAFRYLEADNYKILAKKLADTRAKREIYVEKVSKALRQELKKHKIAAEVSSRSKHIYSIHKKMQSKNLNFEQLFDLRATRILTNSIADCYMVLGIVHNLWTPVPREFDDYISNPKPNNYRSLHTTVRALDKQIVEVQIRTKEMHDFAESGVAAHWRYKENSVYDANFEHKIKWLRQLLNWQKDADNDLDDQLADEYIYVLSPQGEVVELPQGSTALDFAYYIHTDLGHRTKGAKADNKIIPITEPLSTMQHVEILTAKESLPSKDWMDANRGYLKTASARAKVKTWFRKQGIDQNIQLGKSIVHREARRLHFEPKIEPLVKRFNRKSSDDLFAAVGIGDISVAQVVAGFEIKLKTKQETLNKFKHKTEQSSVINIGGVGGLLTSIANCCHPLPGDDILGFITINRGVAVHRQDCGEILHLSQTEPKRVIKINWSNQQKSNYSVNVVVNAYARESLLKDLTLLLTTEKIQLEGLKSQIDKQAGTNQINLNLVVQDISQLTKLLNKIEQLPNVFAANRK